MTCPKMRQWDKRQTIDQKKKRTFISKEMEKKEWGKFDNDWDEKNK